MSQPDYYQRTTCRTCLGKNVSNVLPLPATPVGDAYKSDKAQAINQTAYPMDIYLCADCGLIQLLDVLSPNLLYGHFTYETSISLGLPEHFRKYAAEISTRLNLRRGARVVDIGSNDGTLLRCFKELGFNVLGVDPAKSIAEKATKSGVTTIPDVFTESLAEKILKDHGKASLVVANNTMANIDDLDDFLRGVGKILEPDGTLVIETGYGADVIHLGLFDTIYHEHISFFTVDSLIALCDRLNFKVVGAERIATKGGSLRALMKPAAAKPEVSPSVAELLKYEKEVKCRELVAFKNLENKLNDTKVKLNGVIQDIKKAGGTVAGYGTSVGTTTFNYTLDLGTALDYMFDDNPIKAGKFSPGQGIEIFGSEDVYRKKPTAIVILAWRYTDPILKKHQRFLDEGGIFICPWPEMRVVNPKKNS